MQIGTKMAKYAVIVTMQKTVIVNAIDEDEARDLAELKVNKTNDKWTAEAAWAVA
jgi:ribosomal silencing factor RsfS